MYQVCISCTVIVVNGDMSGVEEENYAYIDQRVRELGMIVVDTDSDELEGVWRTCDVCGEINLMHYPAMELV